MDDFVVAVSIEFPRRGGTDEAERRCTDGARDMVREAIAGQHPLAAGDERGEILDRLHRAAVDKGWMCGHQLAVQLCLVRPAKEEDAGRRIGLDDQPRELRVVSRLPPLLLPAAARPGIEADPSVHVRQLLPQEHPGAPRSLR